MARGSRERVKRARAQESEAALQKRAHGTPRPPRLTLDRFDVIAELKLRSPAAGALADSAFDRDTQLAAYARGGAVAVSVLTEPEEFNGSLADLAAAAAFLRNDARPVMRKDFITDPYQVLEARAAGAGGVLLIVTMLDDATLRELVDCARACGLFALLEGFDDKDLQRVAAFDAPQRELNVLAGVNCRDLRRLDVRFARFAELASLLPQHLPAVAESGITNAEDVARVAELGYRLALVGSSLMTAPAPATLLEELVAAGRAAAGGSRCS
jgi:indole-3-glycerol phosphate synthase